METETWKHKLTGTLLGLLFVGAGLGIIWLVANDPSKAQAPIWVVQTAASTFSFAGLWIILQTFGLKLLGNLAAVVAAYLLAVPGLWMLFDGQGAQCSVDVAFSDMARVSTNAATSWMCRGIFGIGGLIVLLVAVLMAIGAIRQARTGAAG